MKKTDARVTHQIKAAERMARQQITPPPSQMVEELWRGIPRAFQVLEHNQMILSKQLEEIIDHLIAEEMWLGELSVQLVKEPPSFKDCIEKVIEERKALVMKLKKEMEEKKAEQTKAAEASQDPAPASKIIVAKS